MSNDSKTIVGIHGQLRGQDGFIYKTKWRVGKFLGLKQEEVDKWRPQFEYLIDRIYIPDEEMRNRIKADPEGTAEWMHQKIVKKNLKGVDYYQPGLNEVMQHWDDAQYLARFDKRMMDLAESANYRITLISASVGNPDISDDDPKVWRRYFDNLQQCQEMGHAVNLHQYSAGPGGFWQHKYPTKWFAQRLEQTVLPVLDREGFSKVHFVIGEFGLSRLLWSGTAGGWQEWLSEDQYFDQIINIMNYNVQFSDRILGYAMYNTWPQGRWVTHKMDDLNYRLADHYNRNPMTIKPLVKYTDGPKPPITNPIVVKPPTGTQQKYKVRIQTLNFRRNPYKANNIIRKLVKGEVLQKIADSPDKLWYEVRTVNGVVGWVMKEFLTLVSETPVTPPVPPKPPVVPVTPTGLEKRVKAVETGLKETQKYVLEVETILSDVIVRVNEYGERIAKLEGDTVNPPVTPNPPVNPNPKPPVNFTRDLSQGFKALNLSIMEPDEEPEYRLAMAFTSHNGSMRWDEPGTVFHVEEKYVKKVELSWHNPLVNKDLGADTHIHIGLVDVDGNVIRDLDKDIHYKVWWDTHPKGRNGSWKIINRKSGASNQPIGDHKYDPNSEQGVLYIAMVDSSGKEISEVIGKFALPWGWHVSAFCYFQKVS